MILKNQALMQTDTKKGKIQLYSMSPFKSSGSLKSNIRH